MRARQVTGSNRSSPLIDGYTPAASILAYESSLPEGLEASADSVGGQLGLGRKFRHRAWSCGKRVEN